MQYTLSLAAQTNAVPLPAVPEVFGVRLPPASECLTSVDFDLVPSKPPPGVKLYDEEFEEVEESEDEDEDADTDADVELFEVKLSENTIFDLSKLKTANVTCSVALTCFSGSHVLFADSQVCAPGVLPALVERCSAPGEFDDLRHPATIIICLAV